jgi:hypothetical protein
MMRITSLVPLQQAHEKCREARTFRECGATRSGTNWYGAALIPAHGALPLTECHGHSGRPRSQTLTHKP